jgi:hypothetical protein
MAMSGADGNYTLMGLGAGPYTVTPSKSTQPFTTANGIFSNDAALISRHVVGLITLLETVLQIFLLPIQIVVTSFTAIIVALLYLKTRQAGGESRADLLSKFEEAEQPRRKWQERVRNRLIQSGRITGRS